jgi:3-oxoacyl-[acyl-carrier-protein] synthase II
MQFFKCASHTVAMNVAQMLGIRGSVLSPSAACASSMQAIGLGFQLIRGGILDLAFCGGAEEVNSMVVGSFESIFAAAPPSRNDDPETASRPFDARRDGLVCGEGAGVIVLESLDSALARNACILGEVVGYNTSASGSHISQSDSSAIRDCINAALHDAGISPREIDYVSAHATGTVQGDASEAEALRQVFGGRVPVSSLKGGLGHTMGASGAIELAACLMMMRDGVIYPTRNLEQPAEDCSGLNHIRQQTLAEINCFIKNCFAFGGINAVLVCRRFNA